MSRKVSRFFVDPYNGNPLLIEDQVLVEPESGRTYPVLNAIVRFCAPENYSVSFGFQWNKFPKIQIDFIQGNTISTSRFYAETGWESASITRGEKILEVGSGAGRFSQVVLRTTEAQLFSIDYSSAVEANLKNNIGYGSRLVLAQASLYNMPFPDGFFARCFCFGVLQHTPDFEGSIFSLVSKVRVGGEIVVDFYARKGWFTYFHAKYLLRPITKRLPKDTLLFLVDVNLDWMIRLFDILCWLKLGFLTRFIPITDLRGFSRALSKEQRRAWALVDTFDMFSPAFDNPQKVGDVVRMFEKAGCVCTFSGLVDYQDGKAHVVRAIKS